MMESTEGQAGRIFICPWPYSKPNSGDHDYYLGLREMLMKRYPATEVVLLIGSEQGANGVRLDPCTSDVVRQKLDGENRFPATVESFISVLSRELDGVLKGDFDKLAHAVATRLSCSSIEHPDTLKDLRANRFFVLSEAVFGKDNNSLQIVRHFAKTSDQLSGFTKGVLHQKQIGEVLASINKICQQPLPTTYVIPEELGTISGLISKLMACKGGDPGIIEQIKEQIPSLKQKYPASLLERVLSALERLLNSATNKPKRGKGSDKKVQTSDTTTVGAPTDLAEVKRTAKIEKLIKILEKIPKYLHVVRTALTHLSNQLKGLKERPAIDVEADKAFFNTYAELFFNVVKQISTRDAAAVDSFLDTVQPGEVFNLQLRLPDAGSLVTPDRLDKLKSKGIKVIITVHEYYQYTKLCKDSFIFPIISLLQHANHVIFFNKIDQGRAIADYRRFVGREESFTSSLSQVATNLTLQALRKPIVEHYQNNILMFGTIRGGKGFEYAIPLLQELRQRREADFKDTKLVIAGTASPIVILSNMLTGLRAFIQAERLEQYGDLVKSLGEGDKQRESADWIRERCILLNQLFEASNLPIEFHLSVSPEDMCTIFNKCRYAILTDTVKGFAHNASAMITPLTYGLICFANKEQSFGLATDFYEEKVSTLPSDKVLESVTAEPSQGPIIEHRLCRFQASSPSSEEGLGSELKKIFDTIAQFARDPAKLNRHIALQRQYVDKMFSEDAILATLGCYDPKRPEPLAAAEPTEDESDSDDESSAPTFRM